LIVKSTWKGKGLRIGKKIKQNKTGNTLQSVKAYFKSGLNSTMQLRFRFQLAGHTWDLRNTLTNLVSGIVAYDGQRIQISGKVWASH
jgi:hypothetical protein